MAVLYRKYRPQNFSEVLNQKYIIQTLKNQVKSGQLSHAYLFTGSRGVGKTSVARILAKAVNCSSQPISQSANQQEVPCGQCGNCKAIVAGNFLDLVEIDAASNTGVDNIRELIEHVKFSPSLGKYKVFIVDEVHMLSKGAFNALLKTLEEPPKHAIFILATTEINKVPATIVSRTQRFDFKALSATDLLTHLQKVCSEENLKFSNEILELISQNSDGSVRDALSLLDKLITLGDNPSLNDAQQLLGITDVAICQQLLSLIAKGGAQEVPAFFNQLMEKGLDFKILNRDFLEYLRKGLIYKITESAEGISLPDEHIEKLKESTAHLSAPDIMFIIRLFLRSYKDLDSAPLPQIPMLLAALEGSLKKSQDPNKKSFPVVSKAPTLKIEQVMPEIKPPVAESVIKPETQKVTEITLTMLEVEEFWPKVIIKIKEINSPLASLLRNCLLTGVDAGKIILGVRFLFDKKNLESSKNLTLILETLEKVSGKKIGISAQVIKNDIAETVTTGAALGEALKIFGGELIE